LTSSQAISALKLPAETIVVAEPAIPSLAELKSDPAARERLAAMNAAIHEQRRLSASTPPCYAELVAANLFIRRDTLSGTRLLVEWNFRNLGANPKLEHSYEGWSTVQLTGYMTATPEEVESARASLRKAFLTSLVNWAEANLEKHPAPPRISHIPAH
jgi:hypothetical protein